MTRHLKLKIRNKFGIKMSDQGGKTWDVKNLLLAYSRLNDLNDLLKGELKSVIGEATFDLAEHHPDADHPLSTYHGLTSGRHITFFTTGGNAIVKMNFSHEFGHMLNSLPGKDNVFSNQIHSPSFISDNGYINRDALNNRADVYVQASSGAVTEQWADVFANYAAGNINTNGSEGRNMYRFVTGALTDYLSDPVTYR